MQFITEFVNSNGEPAGPQVSLPIGTTVKQLDDLVNQMLHNEDPTPFSFYLGDEQILKSMESVSSKISSENVVKILYRPESSFGIREVSFCSAALPGHSHTILCISYSADGLELASGGGDGSVIFWEVSSQSLKQKLELHPNNWVQCIQWYPDARTVATAGTDGYIRILKRNEQTTEFAISCQFKVSSSPIFALEWEPVHLNNSPHPRIAAATKSGEVSIFDSQTGQKLISTSGHSAEVMCLAWGGEGIIYTASHDKTVKAWDSSNGAQLGIYQPRSGAWRTIAISTAFVLRTGGFELGKLVDPDMKKAALQRYNAHKKLSPQEMIAVGGEDFTISLLTFNGKFNEVSRMTGHTKNVNHIMFSPNGYWLASASYDNTVKLFDGKSGKFICTLGKGRGKNTGCHLGPVYRLAWSADSRLLLSGSADTTVKLWDITHQKLKSDLPGHEDVVYAVDWSPAGGRAASGGKDQKLRLWA